MMLGKCQDFLGSPRYTSLLIDDIFFRFLANFAMNGFSSSLCCEYNKKNWDWVVEEGGLRHPGLESSVLLTLLKDKECCLKTFR